MPEVRGDWDQAITRHDQDDVELAHRRVPGVNISLGLARRELTFFLCRERDDMTALLASKGQQLWMRPNVGLPAVQFHRPLAQFAAGWRKACFCGSSHFFIARSVP
jgi:hypothetical protein